MGIIDVLLITCFYIFFSFPKTKGGGGQKKKGEKKKKKKRVWKSKHFLDWTIQRPPWNTRGWIETWCIFWSVFSCPGYFLHQDTDGMGENPPWLSRVYRAVHQLQLIDWKAGSFKWLQQTQHKLKKMSLIVWEQWTRCKKGEGGRGHFFTF